jgi:hypothetical protein
MVRMHADFYKVLFKEESRGHFSLDGVFWDPKSMIGELDKIELEKPFSKDEIRATIFNSYSEGSPGSDGLPFLFYQKFWDTLKGDICSMVQDFSYHKLDLFRLNFAILTLIPKVDEARDMKNFRPISLLNCSFKIFSKLLTSRLEKVCQSLIAKEQSVFY